MEEVWGQTRDYSKGLIKMALKYAIENSYFHVGDKVFRQKSEFQLDQIQPRFLQIFFFMYMKVNLFLTY